MKRWIFLLLLPLVLCNLRAEGTPRGDERFSARDSLVIRLSEVGPRSASSGLTITLRDETTGQSRTLAYDSRTRTATAPVDPAHRYTIAIDVPGLTPYRKYLAELPPDRMVEVVLKPEGPKVPLKRYTLIVLDKDQRSVVPNAVVKVVDQDNRPVEVMADKGRYIFLLPEAGTFRFDVSAKEYESVVGKVGRSATGVVEVGLTRRTGATQTVAFVARDAFTKLPLAARFRITDTEAEEERGHSATVTTVTNPEFGTELRLNHRYLLEVDASDYTNASEYKPYSASILIKEKEPEPIRPRVILLEPLTYVVTFSVVDARSMLPVDVGTFEVSEEGNHLRIESQSTSRRVGFKPGKRYEVRIEQPGYEHFNRTIAFDKPSDPKDLTKTILLMPAPRPAATTPPPKVPPSASGTPKDVFENLEVGRSVRLDNVYFDQSSYILRPESYAQLDKLVRTLEEDPRLKVQIAGHTDNVGDPRLNQYLSENRAKVIHSYLVNKGVDKNRLRWKGYGSTQPLAANDTEANKAQNRRVEFVVVEN